MVSFRSLVYQQIEESLSRSQSCSFSVVSWFRLQNLSNAFFFLGSLQFPTLPTGQSMFFSLYAAVFIVHQLARNPIFSRFVCHDFSVPGWCLLCSTSHCVYLDVLTFKCYNTNFVFNLTSSVCEHTCLRLKVSPVKK